VKARTLRAIAATLSAVALLLGACGGEEQPGVAEIEGEDGSSSASDSASATGSESVSGESAPAFSEEEADSVVHVTLREWEIEAAPAVASGPKIYFEVTNDGSEMHEMAVTSAGATDEEGAYGEVTHVSNGETKVLTLELPPGKYQLACFIVDEESDGETEDHFEMGMRTEFEVQ
jgi:uncharacterized cupredoxin-like copper-binding protein